MHDHEDKKSHYQKDSLTLVGAVALGTGVMIGAGIFALTGQMAQMTGSLFPLAFLSAAVVVLFSAYSYVKLSNAYVFFYGDCPEFSGAYLWDLYITAVWYR
jgi:amino acid transporter